MQGCEIRSLTCQRWIGIAVATAAMLGAGCGGRSELSIDGTNTPTTTTTTPCPCAGVACGTPPAPACNSRPAPVLAISAGDDHTCALTHAGAVLCWGNDIAGQLGNNSFTASPVPVGVVGLSSGVVAVSAGGDHTCAFTAAGAVKCWGDDFFGQLGDDSHVAGPFPVDVVGLSSGVAAVAAGEWHTCALTAAGAALCWGYNETGQLGDGSFTDSPVPVDVVGLTSGVLAVAAGHTHTCALTHAGAVKCWEDDYADELGDNSLTNSPVPVDPVGLSSAVVAVSAGNQQTCALTAVGAVKCWGLGSWVDISSVPVGVVGLSSGVIAVSVGSGHACAITAAGSLKCWGANALGQLGNGTTIDSPVPVGVVGLSSGVLAVSVGGDYTCALTSAGSVKCWGANAVGQLGNGSTIDSPVPVDVVGL
jgi:alpha-tubulin suppressor-like RCC1 family protein